MFPKGVDYIIAVADAKSAVGVSVSSLYGARHFTAGSTVFACLREDFSIHRYPEMFITPFPVRTLPYRQGAALPLSYAGIRLYSSRPERKIQI